MRRTEILYSKPLGEIIFLLINGCATLTDISKELKAKKKHTTILEHLTNLETLELVKSKKKGRKRIYTIQWKNLIDLFNKGMINEQEAIINYLEDLKDEDLDKIRVNSKMIKDWKSEYNKFKKIMANNKTVRLLIKTFIKTYAKNIHYKERSIEECILQFSLRLEELHKTTKRDLSKIVVAEKEKKEFIWFLKYMGEESPRVIVHTNGDTIKSFMEDLLKI